MTSKYGIKSNAAGAIGILCLNMDLNPVSTKQHLCNVGPTSDTLVRRCTNVVQMFFLFAGKTQ